MHNRPLMHNLSNYFLHNHTREFKGSLWNLLQSMARFRARINCGKFKRDSVKDSLPLKRGFGAEKVGKISPFLLAKNRGPYVWKALDFCHEVMRKK